MKNFELDNQYLTSVHITKQRSVHAGKKTLTDDELVDILKGTDVWTTHYSEDHPEFDKLRKTLEAEGYLTVQKNCWNGDTVRKPFMFNGFRFRKGERFPCAAAMPGLLKFIKKK